MKAKIAIVCVLVLWTSVSHAQLKKCIAADGKVTYSDVQCSSEKKEAAVRGGKVSTVDSSGSLHQTNRSQDANGNSTSNTTSKNSVNLDPKTWGAKNSTSNDESAKSSQKVESTKLYTMPSQMAIERQRNGNK